MLEEFKKFAMRGNVVDMAVGIVIGAAFGKIVSSLVNDVIMPPVGEILGGVDFSNLFINLSDGEYETLAAAQEAGASTINYGQFVNTLINFIIVAFAMFMLVRVANRALADPEEAPADPTEKDCPFCYTSIDIKATRCPNCTSQLEAEAA